MKYYITTTFLSLFIFTNIQAQVSIDRIVNDYMEAHQIPGVAIGVMKNGKTLNMDAYGYADVQNGANVKAETTFELGSLSKQFTAAAILKLQEEGKLSINDYLHQYFLECPDHWKKIKIKHLLWHTSGLPGMYPHDDFKQAGFTGYAKMEATELDLMMQTNRVNKEQAIQTIISDSLDFKPGERYNYSDVGYLVLGIIIDEVTGSYQSYMEEEVFAACGLKNTYLLDQYKVVKNQARGYSLRDGELINIMRTWDYEIPSFFGVFSNVEDLLKWHTTLEKNTFLNEESKAILFSKGKLKNGEKVSYGGGWEVHDINGNRIISHAGITGTKMVIIPEKSFCLVQLTNLGYNGYDFVDPLSLSNLILNAYEIETVINRSHITSDGASVVKFKLKDFTPMSGNYTTADQAQIRIYAENGTPIFSYQGIENEMALLSDGNWLVLGMEYEYILSYNEKTGEWKSNLGRIFIPID